LNVVGVAQALLLAAALFTVRRGNREANGVFAFLLLTISVLLCGGVLTHTRHVFQFPHLAQLHNPFAFLAAPLSYFYVQTLTTKRFVFTKRTLLHFIPSLLCLIYLLPFYFQSSAEKISYLSAAIQRYPVSWRVRTGLLYLQHLFYLVLLMRTASAHLRRERVKRIDRLWVRSLILVFVVVWCVGLLRFLFAHRVETNLLTPLLLTIFVYATAFVALRRPEVLAGAGDVIATSIATSAAPKRYERSTLTSEQGERYLQKLLRVMEIEKPYRDGELTLQKLAARLSIAPQHLSQTINERLNQNFTDFVNAYRIEEAKRGLLDPTRKHYSILAIAEESGFNSKSAFNTVFKKHVQMTPSEFRKSSVA
jgi:AraC-like DNA-binding protein